jgi:hypothetical protein
MKTLTVLILALILVVGGCCKKFDPVTQVETESFSNCLESMNELACNPPASVLVVAAAAAPIIAILINTLLPGSEEWATAANAQAAITAIQKGVCISTKQLAALIVFLESNVFKTAQGQMITRRVILKTGAIQVVDVKPLKDWQANVFDSR